MTNIVLPEITNRIFLIRGHKVMVDEDLARIYGVTTKRLNQQVYRNLQRFPSDFMFQLTQEEADALRLHFATLNRRGRGRHRKYLPYVFTEHGAVMVSAVLKTSVAIQASIHIARAFSELRRLLGSHRELAQKLEQLERRYDSQFKEVFDAIRQLMQHTRTKRRQLPPVPVIQGFASP
jgi:hypothetical protein